MKAHGHYIKGAIVAAACALLFSGPLLRASVDGVDAPTGHLWSDIKSDTFDERAHFAKGVERMSAMLDEQVRELRAKRDGLKTDTADWDLAVKEVEASRSLLAGRMKSLSKANTPETWIDAKNKVGEAWTRSQLAVDKMNSTRTS